MKTTRSHYSRWLLIPALTSAVSAASFEVLPASGDFLGMGTVGAISVDGSTIAAAGWSLATWAPQAVKWTPAAGGTKLDGTLPLTGGAWAVSANGTVLAGWKFNAAGKAACWVNGSIRAMTSFRNSAVNDLNRAGTTAVGRNPTGEKSSYYGVAAKWAISGGTVTSLGDFPGGATQSEATRISADGTTVVGWGTAPTGVNAFRSVNGAAMVNLGDLAGGIDFSEALGVSSDGSVVVGRSNSANGMEAFRWTTSGMTGLGDLTGGAFQSQATGVSGDGAIVVGLGASDGDNEVFIWDAKLGMRSLSGMCAAAGLPVSGYRFTYSRPVISEDGECVAGDAIAPDQTQVLWRLTGLRSMLEGLPKPPVQLAVNGSGVTLRFQAEAGFRYQIQQSTDLAAGKWTNVGSPIIGDGTEHEASPSLLNTPSCFYRLVVNDAP
jgi:probable HAF family extracellular repeat protein